MMVGMLVAGIGLVLAGLLAIGFGIPIKEFSIGNTLILTGVIGVCTGAIMLGLWMAVRELKNIARRLGAGVPSARRGAAGTAAGRSARDPPPAMAVSRPAAISRTVPPAAERRRVRAAAAAMAG